MLNSVFKIKAFYFFFLQRTHEAQHKLVNKYLTVTCYKRCCCRENWGFAALLFQRMNDRNTCRHTNTCLTNTGVSSSFPSNADGEKKNGRNICGRVWWELTQLDWLPASINPQSSIQRIHGHTASKKTKQSLINSTTIHILKDRLRTPCQWKQHDIMWLWNSMLVTMQILIMMESSKSTNAQNLCEK